MKFVALAGLGPPMHVHRHEDECFFVVDGELEVYVGRLMAASAKFEIVGGEQFHFVLRAALRIQRSLCHVLVCVSCWSVAFLPPALAADWPQWMGPGRDNVWREEWLLEKFPAGGR